MKRYTNYLKNLHKGRIGRLRLFLGGLFVALMFYVLLFGIGFLGSFIGISENNSFDKIVVRIISLLHIVTLFYLTTSLAIRRYHDLGKSGWNVLWCFVPLVNIFFTFYLYFAKGEDKHNQYGFPPNNTKPFIRDIFNF